MQDEQSIINAVLSGQTEAFRHLVVRHGGVVFTFARNLVRNHADAEDVSQEIFVAAFRSLGSFDPRKAGFRTWLLTIARNRCLNVLSRPRRPPAMAIDRPVSDLSPECKLSQREFRMSLDAALDDLPIDQRTAFVLAEIQELGHAEIAAIEQVEVGTVKSRVSRAKERLRAALKVWEPSRPVGKSPGTGEAP